MKNYFDLIIPNSTNIYKKVRFIGNPDLEISFVINRGIDEVTRQEVLSLFLSENGTKKLLFYVTEGQMDSKCKVNPSAVEPECLKFMHAAESISKMIYDIDNAHGAVYTHYPLDLKDLNLLIEYCKYDNTVSIMRPGHYPIYDDVDLKINYKMAKMLFNELYHSICF